MATTSNYVPPIFGKMDKLVLKMLDAEHGVPVSQQKYFRVAVPHAFLGSDLIQWLNDNFEVEDSAEALHMANLLMQHGYMFPVIDPTLPVKEDNTLYRFQIPYFWVSINGFPDNVEYAIYLSKRLQRNEQKHGLEEYEAEAYNKLRELLGHMWDFITVQADKQLKFFKEKKKSEKVVLDSQERAFWRLHRPPTGQPSCLEMRYGKAEKHIKKKTAKDYHNEIDRLKFAIKTKPWLKSHKSTEMLVSWCQQFGDCDPFLAGCFPTNPWISDEPTHWLLNAEFVEVPTERRVKRWGFSVQELVRDSIGRQVLETFLESEFSSENIRFWVAVQDLKYSPKSQVPDKVTIIFDEYLASGAPCQVNVDSRTLEAAISAMQDCDIPKRFAFSQAEEHIFTLMSKDSYPRFIRSDIYKGVLSAAQQQGSKRMGWRNFLFNMAGKKMSTTQAPKGGRPTAEGNSTGGSLAKPDATSGSGWKKPSGGINNTSAMSIEYPLAKTSIPEANSETE